MNRKYQKPLFRVKYISRLCDSFNTGSSGEMEQHDKAGSKSGDGVFVYDAIWDNSSDN